ncbi:MAG: LamG domain-containing protein [Spirochaetales bacterium]|nr:LamG domain-containing protein [Spirochaetales bacterium]
MNHQSKRSYLNMVILPFIASFFLTFVLVTSCGGASGGGGGGGSGNPTVTITSTRSGVVNASFTITITFSVEVTGFLVDDITVTNGTADNFADLGSATVFTARINPASEGDVLVDIAAAVCEDLSANPNDAATQFQIYYNPNIPGAVITTTATDPTNASPFTLTITFSESVTGFIIDDITVTNGTKSNFVDTDPVVYTVDITPTDQGAVTALIPAAVCQDTDTNDNLVSDLFSIVYDSIAPDVTITSTETSPTTASPIPVTITFTEAVTDFVMGDLAVGNGTAQNFQTTDNTVFTVDIVPPATGGDVTVDINAAVCQDAAGNDNTAATQFSITYTDLTPPSVEISTASNPTNVSPIPVTITFSETVTGFEETDIGVVNGSTSNFDNTNNPVFTFDITPSGDVTVTVSVAASVAEDGSANPNTAATDLDIVYDGTKPDVSLSSTVSDPTTESSFTVNISFTEEVTGFDLADLTVVNASASNLQTSDNIDFTVDLTANAGGNVSLDIAADVATDLAGNTNNAAPSAFTIVYNDQASPTVVITSSESDPTNKSPIPITITFSEEVTGFIVGEISVTNGAASNFQTTDNIVYTADITPSGTFATVDVDIAAGVAQDLFSNDNLAATTFSIDYDGEAPVVGSLLFTVKMTGNTYGRNTVTINWTEATDNATAQGNLVYTLYYSLNPVMNSVAGIKANGTASTPTYTGAATGTLTIASPVASNYYYNIIVKDEAGNETCYTVFIDVSRNGLVGFFPFAGNANDENMTGTAYNGNVNGATLVAGHDGAGSHAYSFEEASSNSITVTDPVNYRSAAYSLSFWFRIDAPVNNSIFIYFYDVAGFKGYYTNWRTEPSVVIRHRYGDGVANNFEDSGIITTGVWHHCFIVNDGASPNSTQTIYVDGVVSGTPKTSGVFAPIDSAFNMVFGHDGLTGNYYNGLMDQVRVYNRALTSNEITNTRTGVYAMEN